MASRSSSRDKLGRPSLTTAPMPISSYMTNGTQSVLSPSTYDFGRSSESMIQLDSNHRHYATLAQQAPSISLLSASLGTVTFTSDYILDETFDPNADLVSHSYGTSHDTFHPDANLAFPSYGTSSHGIYSINDYTNSGYGNSNSGTIQPSSPHTQPAITVNPDQTSITGSKQYSCTYCGRSFKRRADMERHKKCHGQRSHRCDKCSKCFYRKDKLKEHMKIHKQDSI